MTTDVLAESVAKMTVVLSVMVPTVITTGIIASSARNIETKATGSPDMSIKAKISGSAGQTIKKVKTTALSNWTIETEISGSASRTIRVKTTGL